MGTHPGPKESWCGHTVCAKTGVRRPGFRASQQKSNRCKGRVTGKICHRGTSRGDTARPAAGWGGRLPWGLSALIRGELASPKVSVNRASSKSIAARLARGQRWLQITLAPSHPSVLSPAHTGLQNILGIEGIKAVLSLCPCPALRSPVPRVHHIHTLEVQESFSPGAQPEEFTTLPIYSKPLVLNSPFKNHSNWAKQRGCEYQHRWEGKSWAGSVRKGCQAGEGHGQGCSWGL